VTSKHPPAAPAARPRALPIAPTAPWQAPSVTVGRYVLESYMRSGWGWGELALVVAQFAVLSEFAGDAAYWFGVMGLGLGAQSVLGTAILVRRAMGARAYLPLARLGARGPYVRGMALASCALRVPLFLLFLLLVLWRHLMTGATPGLLLVGGAGLLAGCFVLVTLTVALSPPIAMRTDRIVFLAWLVIALSSYRYVGPLAGAVAVVRAPLWPLFASFALVGPGGAPAPDVLALDAALALGLLAVAALWLAARDLLLAA
jgi:hypothetical protein